MILDYKQSEEHLGPWNLVQSGRLILVLQFVILSDIIVPGKRSFSLLLMAISDLNRKIIWFEISCAPTSHESLAFLTTKLSQRVEHGELPSPFFFLGDSAFICTTSIITPEKWRF